MIPAGGRVLFQISSTGVSGLTHDAPCKADAAIPATTPLRPERNHAPSMTSTKSGEYPFGT